LIVCDVILYDDDHYQGEVRTLASTYENPLQRRGRYFCQAYPAITEVWEDAWRSPLGSVSRPTMIVEVPALQQSNNLVSN
jgi:hypothetical protein